MRPRVCHCCVHRDLRSHALCNVCPQIFCIRGALTSLYRNFHVWPYITQHFLDNIIFSYLVSCLLEKKDPCNKYNTETQELNEGMTVSIMQIYTYTTNTKPKSDTSAYHIYQYASQEHVVMNFSLVV